MTLCRRVQGVEIEGLIISLSQAPCPFDLAERRPRNRGFLKWNGGCDESFLKELSR